MAYSKMKMLAVTGLLVMSVCCLSGCSFSFCGFPIGGKEELVFACNEELPELEEAEQISVPRTENVASEEPDSQAEKSITPDGRVNINSAGLEELMTLSGVGESRAKAIMEYREENGPFQNIEDIMLIPGIKEGIFSKIKEQIAVD